MQGFMDNNFLLHINTAKTLFNSYALGKIIEDADYPNDLAAMEKMIQDICYNNAVAFFRLNVRRRHEWN